MGKMYQRYVGMLLAVLTLTFMFPMPVAAAAPKVTANADRQSVVNGQAVNVAVSISGNPGLSTLAFELSYDSTALQYVSSTWNPQVRANDMKMVSEAGSDTESALNVSLVSESAYTAEGTAVTLHFKAIRDASGISFGLDVYDMSNAALEDVSMDEENPDMDSDTDVDDYEDADLDEEDIASGDIGASGENANSVNPAPEDSTGQNVSNEEPGQDINDIDAYDDEKNNAHESEDIKSEKDTGRVKKPASGEKETAPKASVQQTNTPKVNRTASTTSTTAAPTTTSTSSASSTSGIDDNYKTGVGLGSDLLLIAAVGCGTAALLLTVRKQKKS